MMKSIRRAAPAGTCRYRCFTLIEILAVIAIIAILAALSFGAAKAIGKTRAISTSEANLNAVRGALEAFKTKYGYYPQTDSKYVAVVVCKGVATTGEKSVSGVSGTKLVFGADFAKNLSADILKKATVVGKESGQDVLVVPDGFKDSVKSNSENISNDKFSFIIYRCPGEVNKDSYDLFSAGPDRKYGSTQNDKDNIWPSNMKKIDNTK